jgi:hypothetical protein
MLRIHARQFLKYTVEELWDKLNGDFILVCDDGELEVNEKDVIYSRYAWDLHLEYPKIPMLLEHCSRSLVKNGHISSKTHLKLLGNVVYTVYDTYEHEVERKTSLMENLGKRAYEISNCMYNDLSYRLEAYVVGYDILDFLQITTHKEIAVALEEMAPSQEGIDAVYKIARDVIKNSPDFKDNMVVTAINADVVRAQQGLQCLVLRGFLTDIDSHIFPKPILRSFTSGLRLLSDYMQESRSGAKALANSETPLQKAEYFSRRTQHIAMNVERLHRVDCGSQNYIPWYVRDDEVIDGVTVMNGDLNTIHGKYFLDESAGVLKVIKKTDRHLIGTTVKLRSVFAGCNHPDPKGICEVCYGQGSISVPEHSNIGHYACVNLMEKISQKVLSVKHYDGSSVVEGIYLSGKNAAYMWAPGNSNSYYINKSVLASKHVKLVLSPSEVRGVTDIQKIDDVRKLNVSRVSEFENANLVLTDSDGLMEWVKLPLMLNSRKPSMSHELLSHIKTNGFTIGNDGMFAFDLTGWDYTKPMFNLPMRHFNMSDHQAEIEKFLSGSDAPEKGSSDAETSATDMGSRKVGKRKPPVEDVPLDVLLVRFHDLVNRKIQVTLSALEIVLYSSLVSNVEKRDYRIPKSWDTPEKGRLRQMYNGRSYGALMAFQAQKANLIDPEQYLHTNRPNHVFDSLLLPLEAVASLKREEVNPPDYLVGSVW